MEARVLWHRSVLSHVVSASVGPKVLDQRVVCLALQMDGRFGEQVVSNTWTRERAGELENVNQ